MFNNQKKYYLGTIWVNPEEFGSKSSLFSKLIGNINEIEDIHSEILNSIALTSIRERESKTKYDRVLDIAIVSGAPGWVWGFDIVSLPIFMFSRPKITIEARVSDANNDCLKKEYVIEAVMPWKLWIFRSFSILTMFNASNKRRLYEYKLVLNLGLISLMSRVKRDNS